MEVVHDRLKLILIWWIMRLFNYVAGKLLRHIKIISFLFALLSRYRSSPIHSVSLFSSNRCSILCSISSLLRILPADRSWTTHSKCVLKYFNIYLPESTKLPLHFSFQLDSPHFPSTLRSRLSLYTPKSHTLFSLAETRSCRIFWLLQFGDWYRDDWKGRASEHEVLGNLFLCEEARKAGQGNWIGKPTIFRFQLSIV